MVEESPKQGIWYTPLAKLTTAFQEVADCKECGERCCFLAPIMTYKEALTIQRYLVEHPVEYEPFSGMCPFLNEVGKCHVHSVRPTICLVWGLTNECKFMVAEDPTTIRERIKIVQEMTFASFVRGNR